MKRLTQIVLVGVFLLAVVSSAVAQQAMQPVVRLGNYIEVGNDLWMHIIATSDIRYSTNENLDFEERVREVAQNRASDDTATQVTSDLMYVEARFGVDMRYRKNLTFQLMLEQQSVVDGSLIDSTGSDDNPGGNSVFGQDPEREDQGLHVERFWLRYRFEGTPLTLFVGAELKQVAQVGIFGNDDPGIGIELDFGDLELSAKAYMERESQRIGLTNDNDLVSYAFTAKYDLKPHRFGFDVVYFRDRFLGADTEAVGCTGRSGMGCTGQKSDSVWIDASWSGRFGPVRGLVQGNLIVGTAEGGFPNAGTAPLPPGVVPGRDYDIFAGSAIAYAELDLGVVRPYVMGVYGSADGNPRDRELRGFNDPQPQGDSTQWASGMLDHLDKTMHAGTRDVSCPGRFRGVRTNARPALGARPADSPYAIGTRVTEATAGTGFAECYHGVSTLWNSRLGRSSHPGIKITYSNPGTVLGVAGVRTFPARGHEITGWYVYKAMADSSLLEEAFATEIQNGTIRRIRKPLWHEFGGFWMWTLNPHFDIRLAGNIGLADGATNDLARLSDCSPSGSTVRRPCEGQAVALRGEARFRARF